MLHLTSETLSSNLNGCQLFKLGIQHLPTPLYTFHHDQSLMNSVVNYSLQMLLYFNFYCICLITFSVLVCSWLDRSTASLLAINYLLTLDNYICHFIGIINIFITDYPQILRVLVRCSLLE